MDATELSRWTRFAAKGGIGKCTATHDCVAESPEDLMFLKDDEITVLMQLNNPANDVDAENDPSGSAAPSNGLFLGYCEGVVGRFHGKHVHFHSKLKRPVMTKRTSSTGSSGFGLGNGLGNGGSRAGVGGSGSGGNTPMGSPRTSLSVSGSSTSLLAGGQLGGSPDATPRLPSSSLIHSASRPASPLIAPPPQQPQAHSPSFQARRQASFSTSSYSSATSSTPSSSRPSSRTPPSSRSPTPHTRSTPPRQRSLSSSLSRSQSAASLVGSAVVGRSSPLISSPSVPVIPPSPARTSTFEASLADVDATATMTSPPPRQASPEPMEEFPNPYLAHPDSQTQPPNSNQNQVPSSRDTRTTTSTSIPSSLPSPYSPNSPPPPPLNQPSPSASFASLSSMSSSSSNGTSAPPASSPSASSSTSLPSILTNPHDLPTPSNPPPISISTTTTTSIEPSPEDSDTLDIPPTPTITSPTTPTYPNSVINAQPYNPYLPSVSAINALNPRSTVLGVSSLLASSSSSSGLGSSLRIDSLVNTTSSSNDVEGNSVNPGASGPRGLRLDESRLYGGGGEEDEYEYDEPSSRFSRISLAMSDGEVGIGLSLLADLAGGDSDSGSDLEGGLSDDGDEEEEEVRMNGGGDEVEEDVTTRRPLFPPQGGNDEVLTTNGGNQTYFIDTPTSTPTSTPAKPTARTRESVDSTHSSEAGLGYGIRDSLATAEDVGMERNHEARESVSASLLTEQSRYSSQTLTSMYSKTSGADADDDLHVRAAGEGGAIDTTPTRTRKTSYAESYFARGRNGGDPVDPSILSRPSSEAPNHPPIPPSSPPTTHVQQPSMSSIYSSGSASSLSSSAMPVGLSDRNIHSPVDSSPSPTSPTFSIHSTANSIHTFKSSHSTHSAHSTQTTRSTRTTGTTTGSVVSKLSKNSATTNASGGEDWDGADDIYDDYMYRYSTRFSMASVATGKSYFGGGDGEEAPPVPNAGERRGSGDEVNGQDGKGEGGSGEGNILSITNGSNAKPRPSALSLAPPHPNSTTATSSNASKPMSSTAAVPPTPGTANSLKSTASPLLHTTWGDVLSSPEDEREGPHHGVGASAGMDGQGTLKSPLSPTFGGMASVLRQRFEDVKVDEGTGARMSEDGSGSGGDDEGGKDEQGNGGEGRREGGNIVIDDDEFAPDVSLTTANMGIGDNSFVSADTTLGHSAEDMTVDRDERVGDMQSSITSPKLPLPNPYGDSPSSPSSADLLAASRELAPPPPTAPSTLAPSTLAPPSSTHPSTSPSHLRPSLADLRGERDPESGLRTSIFALHPNAPKPPVEGVSKGPLYIQQLAAGTPGVAGPGGVPFNPSIPYSGPGSMTPRIQSPVPATPAPSQRLPDQHNFYQQPPAHPGAGSGAVFRILHMASRSRGLLGRGPTVFARCEIDLGSAMGPVPVVFSVEPFVGLPPPPPPTVPLTVGTSTPPGTPPLVGATLPRIASESSLRPSPLNPVTATTLPSLASSPAQPPSVLLPLGTSSSPSQQFRSLSRNSSRAASGLDAVTSASASPAAGDIELPAGDSPALPVGANGDNSQQAGGSGANTVGIPRPNFYPKIVTARPRSRSFSEFGSTTAEVPMPVVGDDTQPLKLKIPSMKTVSRAMTSASTTHSPRVSSLKPSTQALPPSNLRTAYAPSPLSIPPTNANLLARVGAPKSPTSPLSQSPLSQSTSSFIPPLSPTSKRGHQLKLATSTPSFRSGFSEPRSPVTAVPPSFSRRRDDEKEAEPTSPSSSSYMSAFEGSDRGTPPRPQRQTSIPDVSVARSSTSASRTSVDSSSRGISRTSPTPPPPSSTGPGIPQVTRQTSLRSKLSLPNLRRKQSRQADDTASIAASSIEASLNGGDREYETAQVKGMDFELVRPSFSQFRNSEDSSMSGARDGISMDMGTSQSGMLRTGSPAMSYSSGQRSPSLADFRTPPPPHPLTPPTPSVTTPKLGESQVQDAATVESHRQRELKWLNLLSAVPSSQSRKNKKVKRLLMEGEVPSSVRYLVWGHLMDAEGKGKGVKGVYESTVARGRNSGGDRRFDEIEKDVRASGVEASTRESMMTVMQAYLTMVPDVKYGRGLTLIARNLLTHAPEEDGFWIFVSMMDSYLRPYFSAVTTSQKEVDAMLFAKALENNDPVIAKKVFTSMGINVLTICEPWFTSVFVNALPPAYLQRVWDIFLFEGIPFILRVGLAIFTVCRRQILELPNNPSTLTPTPAADIIQMLHCPSPTLLPSSPDAFISLVFSCKFKDDDFTKQRAKMKGGLKTRRQNNHAPVARLDISLPRQ